MTCAAIVMSVQFHEKGSSSSNNLLAKFVSVTNAFVLVVVPHSARSCLCRDHEGQCHQKYYVLPNFFDSFRNKARRLEGLRG